MEQVINTKCAMVSIIKVITFRQLIECIGTSSEQGGE